MEHFIITRFNVSFDGIYNADKNKIPINTNVWLENRFDLFDKYCFPSVTSQSVLDFKWHVYFDINTPDCYKEKIDSYSKIFPAFFPFFVENDSEFHKSCARNIENSILFKDCYVITTRLDNDDALNKNFIELVQSNFSPENNLFIDLISGAQYHTQKNILIRFESRNSHFVSKIEYAGQQGIGTVMSVKHREIEKNGNVKYFRTNNPMWIEVIHEKNLVNTTVNSCRVLLKNKINQNLYVKISKFNSIKFFLLNTTSLPKFILKKILNRINLSE